MWLSVLSAVILYGPCVLPSKIEIPELRIEWRTSRSSWRSREQEPRSRRPRRRCRRPAWSSERAPSGQITSLFHSSQTFHLCTSAVVNWEVLFVTPLPFPITLTILSTQTANSVRTYTDQNCLICYYCNNALCRLDSLYIEKRCPVITNSVALGF